MLCADNWNPDLTVRPKCGQRFADKQNDANCQCPCHARLPGTKSTPADHSASIAARIVSTADERQILADWKRKFETLRA